MGRPLILTSLVLAACVAREPMPSGPPAAYPIALEAHAACALEGRIYVFGGVAPELEKRGWSYDPRKNGWQPLPDMPRARCFHAAAAAGGRIYLFGGIVEHSGTSGQTAGAKIDCFDPATGLWTTVSRMPTPRNRLAAAAVDDRIFVIAGMERRANLENTALVEIYDPRTAAWTRGADAPQPGHGHAVAVVGREIVVVGGLGDLRRTFIYDTRADKWREGAVMPEERLFAAAAAAHGAVYVAGDRADGNIPLLRYDVAANKWDVVAPASVKTHRTACVALNGLIYVIGGEDNVNFGLLSRVSRYDPAAGAWQHSE